MFKILPNLTSGRLEDFKHFTHYEYFLSYYLQSRIGRKKPLLAGLKLTHACNLQCIHCPFWPKTGASLSFKKAVACMKTLHKWGVRILIIEGGEPFLWRDGEHDLRHVVAEARKLFFSVGVTTNGTFPLDLDSDVLWVSIDGLKETHDHIRGESFDLVMANIEASSHPRLFAHITINTLNWQEIPELVSYLASKVKGITIQFHYPYERPAEDDDLFLPLKHRLDVLDRLIALKKQGLPVLDSYACLEALKENRWICQPWMIANINPDGTMAKGCYVKDRGKISCAHCGFAAHAEIALAYNGNIEAMFVGKKIFERTT
jgi:MoaA/NifB/PqqE/SkfB family radical SAM enzyme